ncbi:MAG: lipocalin-like domain-containing protein [Muribaculaceae bacterium]|nr:lipocalin-like domain-containing protein [Muribaculaceae bacterium]
MKAFFSAISVILFMSICGCTQNNGYIGPIFGSWSLKELSSGSEHLELTKETVFSFQNEVVRISQISENPYAGVSRYGNFTISDEYLSLTFLTELTPDGEGSRFLVPSWLYFPKDVMPLIFKIKELKGNRMVLVLNDGTKELTYSFAKTW